MKCVAPSSSRLLFRLLAVSSTTTATVASCRLLVNPTACAYSSFFQSLRGGSSTTTRIMTTDNVHDISTWEGSGADAFSSLEHPGYSLESDPDTFVGGWLAHRAALEHISAAKEGDDKNKDWIQEEVAPFITKFDYSSMPIGRAPKILILYGSLRPTSFSRKLAYEFARLLELVGCDVRVYNPRGLPVRDPALEDHIKVKELRALTHWSDGHMWVS